VLEKLREEHLVSPAQCNDSCDSVIYGATRTSITVVSKFPRKTWRAMHTCTNSGYQALLFDFFQVPGNKARW